MGGPRLCRKLRPASRQVSSYRSKASFTSHELNTKCCAYSAQSRHIDLLRTDWLETLQIKSYSS